MGDHGRVNLDGRPPRRFVPTVVEFPMMQTAKRNRELITDFAA